MEASALKYQQGLSLQARVPFLRLQSDERLIALTRRGVTPAFEVLVKRYEARLLSFCRHLLGSREDAEDVLQEVFAAAFNAMVADERPINVRPWLYRIARNRSLNHLRRAQAVGVDSMDVHFSEFGATTADKVHEREEFRLLVGDINQLPETQKTALVLREMDALSYEQIAEAMETTVSSVKSLLVRARVSLAEAAEARALSCAEVRMELGEVAEGLLRKPSPLVRRHLRTCTRCDSFRLQLKETNKQLAALLPFGPLVVLKKLALAHLGHSASSSAAGSGVGAAGGAAGSAAAGSAAGFAGSSAAGTFVSAGFGAVATKAAAGLAAAALVTAGAVEVDRTQPKTAASTGSTYALHASAAPAPPQADPENAYQHAVVVPVRAALHPRHAATDTSSKTIKPATTAATTSKDPKAATLKKELTTAAATVKDATKTTTAPGRTQTQTDATVLPPTSSTGSVSVPDSSVSSGGTSTGSSSTSTSSSSSPSADTSSSSSSGTSSTGSGSNASDTSGTSTTGGTSSTDGTSTTSGTSDSSTTSGSGADSGSSSSSTGSSGSTGGSGSSTGGPTSGPTGPAPTGGV